MTIALFGNTLLRAAIQRNLVSFPGQVAAFTRRGVGDTQERIVQLYFVRGWSVRRICERYRMSKVAVQNLLSEWRIRAVAAGHIQEIDPESLRLMVAGQETGEGHFMQPARLVPDLQEPLTGRLMSALKEECSDLGVELTVTQAERMLRALQQIAGQAGHTGAQIRAQGGN
jgi:transposase-like protein